MRIYACADIHGKERHIEAVKHAICEFEPDIAIIAGDIARFFNQASVIASLDTLGLPVYAVTGNSDRAIVKTAIKNATNITSLHMARVDVTIGGMQKSISGVDGTFPLPFRSKVSIFEARTIRKLDKVASFGGILVVHPPPLGTLDQVFGSRLHAGSGGIARYIEKAKPEIVICGHIHESAGVGNIGETLVINCAMGKNVNGAIIEVDDGTKPRAKLI